jgi:hypothetical protein
VYSARTDEAILTKEDTMSYILALSNCSDKAHCIALKALQYKAERLITPKGLYPVRDDSGNIVGRVIDLADYSTDSD